MFQVVFWMNIPSHYQRDFFHELAKRRELDLLVRYFDKFDSDRKKLGWNDEELAPNEAQVRNPEEIREIPDYRQRIHVVLGDGYDFNRGLLDIIDRENLRWVHWSEPYGIRVWERAHYRSWLALPLMHLLYWKKRPYGKRIAEHALFAMGQGTLAKRNFMRWGVPEAKIRMLYYCGNPRQVTRPELRSELGLADSRIFFNIGQLNYRKGIDLLLKAFRKLRGAKNWKLIFVGHDYTEGHYRNLVRRWNLEERVIFLPAIPPQEIGNYVNLADVLVLPSRYDGWGIVLNEAASLSKALIGTETSGASWHVIRNGENGWRVPATVSELQLAMQRYVDNPELVGIHGATSGKIFDSEFSAACNAERFVSYLKEFAE